MELKSQTGDVDNSPMTESLLQLDSLHEQNLQVMQAYSVRASAAKAAGAEDFDGWLDRLDSLSGHSPEELTQYHGQLIALGFLKFEISGRSVGLRYQISPKGKRALERALAQSAEESEACEDLADAA